MFLVMLYCGLDLLIIIRWFVFFIEFKIVFWFYGDIECKLMILIDIWFFVSFLVVFFVIVIIFLIVIIVKLLFLCVILVLLIFIV